ncbi:MAG TPA: hypothetical protein VK569_09945 [Bacteroidota bacterium]|nr:hypothetical protein [Bacteroidota bacterium]
MNGIYVSGTMAAFLSLFVGCYSTGTVTREELIEKTQTDQADITVHMKDAREYKFSRMNYRIEGDTLFGLGRLSSVPPVPDSVVTSISFADMSSIETERFDLAVTFIVIAVPVAAVAILVAAWAEGMSNI